MSANDNSRIYLDYAASTPVRAEVTSAMEPYYSKYYNNPSSIYQSAQTAKNAIEKARRTVADLLNAKPKEIYFTSGGTESNNWALFGTFAAHKSDKNKLIISRYEHHSVLKSAEFIEYMGGEISHIDIKPDGTIDIDRLQKQIDDNTFLVSIMTANNEIGSINPIYEISELCSEKNVLFHTDAVAAGGQLEINADKCNLLSLSAHKFYGPKGVGILYIKDGTNIKPLLYGGEQERGIRAGTENVAAIVGCARALELAVSESANENKRINDLRDYFEEQIKINIPKVKINNAFSQRLPNYLNISLPGVSSQTALISLDLNGIECSNGSACMAGGTYPSHVLQALNLPENQINNALRFTLGKYTDKSQIDKAISILTELTENLYYL